MEANGVLGTLWASLGLGGYYAALTWINILLGIFLTPLFALPATWLMDKGKRTETIEFQQ
jgi:hypothetical protein